MQEFSELPGVWKCNKRDGSSVDFYFDSMGILPYGGNRFYYMVGEVLEDKDIEKTVEVCAKYNPTIIPPALLFLMRAEDAEKLEKTEDEKTAEKDEKWLKGEHLTRLRELETYLKRLLETFLHFFPGELDVVDLDRFGWGYWFHILKEGDIFFDDEAKADRVATRAIINAIDSMTTDEFKKLHLLQAVRTAIHSQKR